MKENIWKHRAFAFALSGLIALVPTVGSSDGAFLPIERGAGHAEYLGAEVWRVASSLSDQVKVKIVVTDRRRRGDVMDASFRIEFSSLPQGKRYYKCFWLMGMKLRGDKPQCMPPGSVWPMKNGKIVIPFTVSGFDRGEWVQFTVRSTDRSVEKSARFIPFK